MLEDVDFKIKNKIKQPSDLARIIKGFRGKKKVIMCHGVFDVVHPGHVRHLLYAKGKGDILIVSLTADKYITKGLLRPHVPEQLRAFNLAAFEMVDYVLIDNNPEPYENLKLIRPDFFAKGYEYVASDPNPKTLEEKKIVESYGGEMLFTPGDIVYSSSKFLDLSAPKIGDEKLQMLMESENISFKDITDCIHSLKNFVIHVVGDTIVDSYTDCKMIGGMTKTPTISVRYEKRIDYVGGAGIVAKHLRAAGARVIFTTILGDDSFQEFVLDDLRKFNVECNPFFDSSRPTTVKNAIVVGDYRLLKIDTLDNRPISDKGLNFIKAAIEKTSADAVVFSDFRHGIFSKNSIKKLIESMPENTLKIADSQVASRWGNILDFKEFDLITPNEKEARFSMGDQDSTIRSLGQQLLEKSKAKNLFLKLGESGLMILTEKCSQNPFFVDSFVLNAKDPVGAGDAMLAYATLALLSSGNPVMAGIIGSLAAAVECEKDGNIPIEPEEILQKLHFLENRINYVTV
jgi:rfaE bifunctional protein kinase chain/domain